MPHWSSLIREVPDFPKPGIVFKDITPVLADARGFAGAIDAMAAPWRDAVPDAFIGIESRGFIFAAALAQALGTGFVPVRKPGKLPAQVIAHDYALEYGRDRLEMHADALRPGARVVLVDDVLATGGTLRAALSLAQRQGATVTGAAVLVELPALRGRALWDVDAPLHVTLQG